MAEGPLYYNLWRDWKGEGNASHYLSSWKQLVAQSRRESGAERVDLCVCCYIISFFVFHNLIFLNLYIMAPLAALEAVQELRTQ